VKHRVIIKDRAAADIETHALCVAPVPPTRPALRPRWCSSTYTPSPILQAASAALLACRPPLQRWYQSAAKPLPCPRQRGAEAPRRSGSLLHASGVRGRCQGSPRSGAPLESNAAKPLPCCRRPKRRRLAGAVSVFRATAPRFAVGAPSPFARQGDQCCQMRGEALRASIWISRGEAASLLPQAEAEASRRSGRSCLTPSAFKLTPDLLPVAFKPGRRLRPAPLALSRRTTHDALRTTAPARTETAPRAPSPHDSYKSRKPLRHQRQPTLPLPLHTTPVRTATAHAPTCSRTRFSRSSGRTSGSGVQRHGSPVVQRASSEVWSIAYGCGRHSRASRLEIVERTPREQSRAFNVHGQIS
jgi:hypothetical protein